MNHGRNQDGAILDTTYSEERTLSKTYQALEGFSGNRYKNSQDFVSSSKSSDMATRPLTAEDVIRSAKKQPQFTYNTVASDLLVFSITLIGIIFAGGLIMSAAIAPVKTTVEQLSRELPMYPE